jgi:hypothetical protein
MKDFRTSLGLLILAVMFLTSCGGGSKKQEVNEDKVVDLKPYQTKVKGYLSDVFEVVDATYKFEINKDGGIFPKAKIQIQIKSVAKGNAKDYGFVDGNGGPLYLTVCDINGRPLSDFSDISSSYAGDGLLKDMVSKVGEENWILFDMFTHDKQLSDDAATFIVSSKQIEKPEESNSVSSSNSSSSDDDDDDDDDKEFDRIMKAADKAMEMAKEMKKLEKD